MNANKNSVEQNAAAAPTRIQKVTIDGREESTFVAAHVEDGRWNGFAMPWFTQEVARKVTDWANTSDVNDGVPARFRWDETAGSFFEFDTEDGTE